MNLIFVHIGNKKVPYLNDSIRQALIFNKKINVHLISNKITFKNLSPHVKKKIIFEDTNKIILKKNHKRFIKNSLLDNKWYSGFWKFTSERFFYIQNIVEKKNLKNIIHVENDLMIYFDIKSKLNVLEKNYNIGLLLDSNIKAIPSFLYFKDDINLNKFVNFFEKEHSFINKLLGKTVGKVYKKLLNKNFYLNNDMDVLFKFYLKNFKNNDIDVLPSSTTTLKKNKKYAKNINISKHYKKFGGIFDPANFGLYLDGFDRDPIFSNAKINKKTFILNSAVDVTKYKIKFKKINNKRIPYLIDKKILVKLLTLHIHSKRLNKFLSKKHPA